MLDAETQKDLDELHASFAAEEMLTRKGPYEGRFDPLAPVHQGGRVSIARHEVHEAWWRE